MGEIKTFGALLGFSIKLEESIKNFYCKIIDDYKSYSKNILDEFSELVKGNRKRKLTLERIRRENINEMILQAISGLKPDGILTNIKGENSNSLSDILQKAIKLEEKSSQFYLDAANRANLILAEASRYFRKLAKENYDRCSRIELVYSKLRN